VFADLIIAAALFIMWAFFAGSETAYVATNRFRLYNLKKRGKQSALLASFLLEKPDRLLSTTLVGVNLSLVLSSNLIARFYMNLFEQPKPFLSLLTITILSLIFCEVLPKNFALVRSFRWTLISSVPLFIFYILFFPVGQIFSFLTKMAIRLLGIPHSGFVQSLFKKKEDVKFFISNHLESHYTEDESRYFQDTVDFGEKRLSDVMVPLVDIMAMPDTSKVRDCLQFIEEHNKYSIPVYRKRIDNVVGLLTAREIIDVDKEIQVSTIMRDPVFIPEHKNISALYREAYEQGISTVFAVDEYGGIVGLATMYDIGEEIVGRINNIEAESLITPIKEGSYLCDGDVEIDELEQLLGFEIEHEDFTTLNGLFVQKLGKIPKKGDTLKVGEYRLTVIKGSTKKADLISIQKEV
jgi:CBS domain containing-hemolysin-like protein